MFKKFVLGLFLGVVGISAAYADTTMEGFPVPTDGLITSQVGCAGNSFSEDGSTIIGACSSTKTSACSGRGCQPVRYKTFYNVTWSVPDLVPSVADACMMVRTHAPQAPQYTFYNGHVAADCHGLSISSPSVTMVNGAPYYLIAVSPTGLYEIVANFSISYLVTF